MPMLKEWTRCAFPASSDVTRSKRDASNATSPKWLPGFSRENTIRLQIVMSLIAGSSPAAILCNRRVSGGPFSSLPRAAKLSRM